ASVTLYAAGANSLCKGTGKNRRKFDPATMKRWLEGQKSQNVAQEPQCRRLPQWVTSTHARSHTATTEVPHKADQIAAAPRTEQVCQDRKLTMAWTRPFQSVGGRCQG